MPARPVPTIRLADSSRPAPSPRRSGPGGLLARWISGTALGAALVLAVSLLGPVGDDAAGGGEEQVDLAASSTNPVTPGAFTGYGFDQCLTPNQAAMDAWLQYSPFRAVGVYTSGSSRACRDQPNLTPTWVSTQLAKGWRILPIHLGPQSTCVGRFPRYGQNIDPTIITTPGNGYAAARAQGAVEADRAVDASNALGIVPGSTLWYDVEGWSNYRDATCREATLSFLTGWTVRIHERGYVSGVYSSAGSGMRILDDARIQGRADVALPDAIWLARYDNVANTSASKYFSDAGWQGARIKQYTGGHLETWGGVTINIDRNWLELGPTTPPAESHCGGTNIDLSRSHTLTLTTKGTKPVPVTALQCLLKERGFYKGGLTGYYGKSTRDAARAWQRKAGFPVTSTWSKRHWIALYAYGRKQVLKVGSAGLYVRRAQRAIKIALPSSAGVVVNGVYDAAFAADVKAYRRAAGLKSGSVMTTDTWKALLRGRS